MTITLLDTTTHALLDALGDLFAAIQMHLGSNDPESQRVVESMTDTVHSFARAAAVSVVRRVTGGREQLSDEELAEAASALGVVSEHLRLRGLAAGWPSVELDDDALMDAFESASRFLRKTALEEFEVLANCAPTDAGEWEIAWERVPPARAHLELFDDLMSAVEAVGHEHPLAALELEASGWWFVRDSLRDGMDDAGLERQAAREMEWVNADRRLLSFGETLLGVALTSDIGAALGRKQERLARGLRRSRPALYEVVERRGEETVLRSLLGRGSHARIIEYDPGAPYDAGWLAFGRVIALRGLPSVRSPGMEFVKPPQPEMGKRLAAGCRRLERDGVPRAAALEVVLARDVLRRRVPNAVAPAMDAKDARETLSGLLTELRAANLVARRHAKGVTDGTWGDSAGEYTDPTGTRWAVSPDVDAPVRAWLEALRRYAEANEWVAGDEPPSPRSKHPTRVLKFRGRSG
jgi:hypothetical protein